MNAKADLLLIPGLLCTGALWSAQIPHLEAVATPLVTEEHARHASIGDIARAILATAPARFALAGFSFGGYVAFEILRQAPERVQKLALLDTSARPDTADQAARRRGLMELAEMGRFKGVTPKLLPLFLHPERLDDADLVMQVTEMAADIGKDGFLRQQQAILGRPDSRSLLPQISCPTLVLCGAQDQLTPAELSEEMADGIRNAELVLVDHCGHMSPIERPQAVSEALVDWLRT